MNIKEVSNKIIYGKYNFLTEIRAFPFKYEEVSDIFSDFNFIEAYKDKGEIFWHNLIHYTKIPIDVLFDRYNQYLTNNKLFLTLKESNSNFCYLKNIGKIRANLKAYFYEYKKHINKA